ncbi:unnamed protein product [Triticum turgidum subsp. durum]|uniref:Late embryogenesis abundant protein LEA-2 subgroup domain-containing protein n=1 Tax=Triticum turgidum subsp. durum TaxID=4567 RepID=A0A9R1BI21_TRITD|nr:unnamed protein product [Triticum turgidum subsp. durum]
MVTSGSGQFKSAGPVWSPKKYILAATTVTLAVSAVAVLTTVVLSPARIAFSVTGASSSSVEGASLVALNFTLDAANPSRRAGVEYSSVTARLQLYSASHAAAAWLKTEVHQAMPLQQPPASSRSLRASVLFDCKELGCCGRAPPMTVLVLAQVRFKVGLAYSRQYDVQVSCQPVDFFAATAAAAATRVVCVA